ncbi:hypothetical protein FOL47_002477 [Perkinsus chesapeaki]|uniref:Uncharacterized protein n=1 Tax=Perkinsus chesapeaki TaxID=330153 RepID=A0A7J6MD45_PERCH|nr:hypothetical protein FOL47_002477 [Perkinsus chesapeaki]
MTIKSNEVLASCDKIKHEIEHRAEGLSKSQPNLFPGGVTHPRLNNIKEQLCSAQTNQHGSVYAAPTYQGQPQHMHEQAPLVDNNAVNPGWGLETGTNLRAAAGNVGSSLAVNPNVLQAEKPKSKRVSMIPLSRIKACVGIDDPLRVNSAKAGWVYGIDLMFEDERHMELWARGKTEAEEWVEVLGPKPKVTAKTSTNKMEQQMSSDLTPSTAPSTVVESRSNKGAPSVDPVALRRTKEETPWADPTTLKTEKFIRRPHSGEPSYGLASRVYCQEAQPHAYSRDRFPDRELSHGHERGHFQIAYETVGDRADLEPSAPIMEMAELERSDAPQSSEAVGVGRVPDAVEELEISVTEDATTPMRGTVWDDWDD